MANMIRLGSNEQVTLEDLVKVEMEEEVGEKWLGSHVKDPVTHIGAFEIKSREMVSPFFKVSEIQR